MGSTVRLIDKLESVACSGMDLVSLWRETGPLLAEAVPHFEAACFFTVDPSSLLTTSHFQEELPEIPAEWLGREYAEASVLAVSGHVLSGGIGPAESRVRTGGGRWIVLHGSRLIHRNGHCQVSVVIEAAQPTHLTSRLMRAYGLTSREQEVTRRVLRGESTETIAGQLAIAPGTVQAHLRNIFEKTGVRSRRELVSVTFQRHYEPRVRDNEYRTTTGLPSRHGPMPADTTATRASTDL